MDWECGCWVEESEGVVLRAYSCPECIKRALDFLEQLLYLDKVGSVSALRRDETELARSSE